MSYPTEAPTLLEDLEAGRRTVATDRGTISFLDIGSGPVALFVHGVGTNAYLWRNVLGAVAGDGRRCVAVDLPLHGRSPAARDQPFGIAAFAELLEAFCAELGIEEADVVANDSGGAIAQVFAARHPERIRSFVLTNCETHDNVPPPAFKPTVLLARAGIISRLGPRLARNLPLARRVLFAPTYERLEALPLEVVRSYVEPTSGDRRSARELERWLISLRSEDLLAAEPALQRLEAPTLVVWGTGDRFFDVKWADWLARTIPGVTRVAKIPGARLFFPDERAAELVPMLSDHWTRYGAA